MVILASNKKRKENLQFLLKIIINTTFFYYNNWKFYHTKKKNISKSEIRCVHRIKIITKFYREWLEFIKEKKMWKWKNKMKEK